MSEACMLLMKADQLKTSRTLTLVYFCKIYHKRTSNADMFLINTYLIMVNANQFKNSCKANVILCKPQTESFINMYTLCILRLSQKNL